VKKRLGTGDSISDVVAKILEIVVSLSVGQRGVDELCGGRFVGADNTLSNTQAVEERGKQKQRDGAEKKMQGNLLIKYLSRKIDPEFRTNCRGRNQIY
jgi:hypothetical protein